MLGYCILTDKKHFIEWFRENATVKGKNKETGLPDNWFHNRWKNFFYPRQNVFCGKGVTNIFETRSYASSEEDWKNKKRELDEFLGMVSYLESEGEKLQVFTMEGDCIRVPEGLRQRIRSRTLCHQRHGRKIPSGRSGIPHAIPCEEERRGLKAGKGSHHKRNRHGESRDRGRTLRHYKADPGASGTA